jgi:heptosyltransferase I
VRVLLTRLSALGDIVHTWPLVEALRRSRADLELMWLVERPFACLVNGHPGVAHVATAATRRWRKAPWARSTRAEARALAAELRAFAPDVVLDPQGLVKSSVWGALSGAPDRAGLARNWRREALAGLCYTRTVEPAASVHHVVDINLAMAQAIGVDAQPGAVPDGRFLLGQVRPPVQPGPGTVLLLPATGGKGKAWGAEAFSALAVWLLDHHLTPLVAWGPGERPLAETIAAAAGPGALVAPPTSILELAELASRCTAVVGGDTGTVHLAASLGVPTLAVFVATDPERNGPRGACARVVAAVTGSATGGSARARPSGTASVTRVAEVLESMLAGR